ncbi:hypothetical protein D3C76_1568960 [compost metagenome]
MVIRHNDINSQLSGVGDLMNCADPGIYRNNKRNTLLDSPVERMVMQPVAFIGAVRDIDIKGSAKMAQQIDHQGRAGDTVSIIIPIH